MRRNEVDNEVKTQPDTRTKTGAKNGAKNGAKTGTTAENLLEVHQLKKYFPIRKGLFRRLVGNVRAVDDVSFSVKAGQTLGLVGESGSGKSTVCRSVIRLYEPTAGEIKLLGKDFHRLSGPSLRLFRRHIQMVFQDPLDSLDPRMNVRQILTEPLKAFRLGHRRQQEEKVKDLLHWVGLKPNHLDRYPHEFSGGQRQRLCIARALALGPQLIIADEPVSSLDVSIQAQILNLFKDLQDQLGLSYLFVSHDLAVVAHMSNDVAVMYLGRIVEMGRKEDLFAQPLHPYTQALMASIPKIAKGKKGIRKILSGEIPNPTHPPTGCHFHPRCEFKMKICEHKYPPAFQGAGRSHHWASCWLYEKQK